MPQVAPNQPGPISPLPPPEPTPTVPTDPPPALEPPAAPPVPPAAPEPPAAPPADPDDGTKAHQASPHRADPWIDMTLPAWAGPQVPASATRAATPVLDPSFHPTSPRRDAIAARPRAASPRLAPSPAATSPRPDVVATPPRAPSPRPDPVATPLHPPSAQPVVASHTAGPRPVVAALAPTAPPRPVEVLPAPRPTPAAPPATAPMQLERRRPVADPFADLRDLDLPRPQDDRVGVPLARVWMRTDDDDRLTRRGTRDDFWSLQRAHQRPQPRPTP